MKLKSYGAPVRVCIGTAVLLAMLGWGAAAVAQDHGAGIRKSCLTATKVGDLANCTMRVLNEDEFGDTIEVLEFWDVVGTGADQFRVPATGNLPIIEVSAGVSCASDPDEPIGLTFPCLLDGTAQAGGSGEYVRVRSEYTVPDWATDPLLDQANAIVRDLCDAQDVGCSPALQNLQFGAAVSLFEPDLEVTKTGPDQAKVGDEICYEIGFVNASTGTGFPGFENCTGTDSVLGDLGTFQPGASQTFCHTPAAGATSPVVNTATITCDVIGFDNQIADSDDHSVDLIDPAIEVTKSGPDTAKVGDEVCWDIGFENTGTGALENCSGSDSFLGDLGAFEAGVTQSFCHTTTASDPNPIENTATITCDVIGFDNQIADSDDHSVDLIDPAIEVTKSGPDTAKVGDEVCWDIGFENTGSGALENCSGSDSFLGDLGAFEAGVTQSFCHTTTASDPNPIENTATITCDVAGFDNQVSDSDDHSVDLIDPAIEVTKSGPDTAKVGDEVCWDIGFENTGSGTLENCSGSDSFLGDLGAFEAGVTQSFCHTTTASDPNPIENTATITCDVAGFDNQVSDSDDHSVDLIDPSIEVTKSGPDSAKVGDEVCWDIGFENTGSGALENCSGSDSFLGDLGAFESGVTQSFCHTTTASDPNPIENTVTITCDVAGFDNQVSDSDDHSVDLVEPGVNLTKQCHPDPVLVGDSINWSILVENTGNIGLECLLNDPDAGFIDEAFSLDPGESESFEASRLVEIGDTPVISNTASVSCDVAGFDNQVSDEDSADCEVEIPGEEVCRTPGFWGTHGGTEHPNSTNLTQLVIDAAGGELHVCGTTVSNTDVGSVHSALEAMCVRVGGVQQRQLARQLTAMALNCMISNGSDDCAGTSVEGLFADANAACAAADENLNFYIDRVDCFNNGGQWNDDEGFCFIDPEDPNNCQNRDLDYSTDIFDGVSPLPGPAGSARACNAALRNDVYIVP
jgi:hypothetical protein